MMGKPRFLNSSSESIEAQKKLTWSGEIAQRLVAHLEFIQLTPKRILNLGSGPLWGNDLLRQRFPEAMLINTDLSWSMLKDGQPQRSWWQQLTQTQREHFLCADGTTLPLKTNSIDLVFCHLLLPVVQAEELIKEVKRVLSPNGLFLFSSFGPDTLREISLPPNHQAVTRQLVDMHNVGDALVNLGWQHPVMDRENLQVTFVDQATLIHDFYAFLGFTPSRLEALRHLTPWQKALLALKSDQDNQYSITLEINYGHAWKSPPLTTSEGKPIIPIQSMGLKK